MQTLSNIDVRTLVAFLFTFALGAGVGAWLRVRRRRRTLAELQDLLADSEDRRSAAESQLVAARDAEASMRRLLREREDHGVEYTRLQERLRGAEERLAAQLADWTTEREDLQRRVAAYRPLQVRFAETDLQRRALEQSLAETQARLQVLQSDFARERDSLLERLRDYEVAENGLLDRQREQTAEIARVRARLAELEPQAGTASYWQARHDIVERQLQALQVERIEWQRNSQLSSGVTSSNDPEFLRTSLEARERRIRELELDLARLRNRVLELEPLRGALDKAERKLALLQAERGPLA